MYSWWWVRLSPETCRVKSMRRIKTQLLHLVGLTSLLQCVDFYFYVRTAHFIDYYLFVATKCALYLPLFVSIIISSTWFEQVSSSSSGGYLCTRRIQHFPRMCMMSVYRSNLLIINLFVRNMYRIVYMKQIKEIKCESCWSFSHIHCTMQGSENVQHVYSLQQINDKQYVDFYFVSSF